MENFALTAVQRRKVYGEALRREGWSQQGVHSFEREIPFHCRVQCSMWLVLVLFVSSDFGTSDGVLALGLRAKPYSGKDEPVSPAPEA